MATTKKPPMKGKPGAAKKPCPHCGKMMPAAKGSTCPSCGRKY